MFVTFIAIIIFAKHCVISKWTLRSVPMQNSIYCVRETFYAYRSSCKVPIILCDLSSKTGLLGCDAVHFVYIRQCAVLVEVRLTKRVYGDYTRRSYFLFFLQLRLATTDTTYRSKCFFSKFYISKRIFLSSSNVFTDFSLSIYISVQ